MNKNDEERIKKAVLHTFRRFKSKAANISLPLDLFRLIDTIDNIALIPYSQIMNEERLNYSELLKIVDSPDAYTAAFPAKNNYMIFYNDIEPNIVKTMRYRWSIAHELGHIALKHHAVGGRDALYRELEREADDFATRLLIPFYPLKTMGVTGARELVKLCGVSSMAARRGFEEYYKWLGENTIGAYDTELGEIFFPSRYCLKCERHFNISKGKRCVFCQSRDFIDPKTESERYFKLMSG